MNKLYIVVMRNEDVWLEGPFDDRNALIARGHNQQMEAGDDPRCQSVDLPDGHAALALLRNP